MRAFLDTSVLVPVFYEDHQHHQPSFSLFGGLGIGEGCCSAHTLAEVYATLTAMPGRDRASGTEALLFLQSIRERLTLIHLTGDEYFEAAEVAAGGGFSSGGIYDVVIGHCARKAQAETIYTWNLKRFLRLPPELARRMKAPE